MPLEGKGIDCRTSADVAVIAASASTLHTQDERLDGFSPMRGDPEAETPVASMEPCASPPSSAADPIAGGRWQLALPRRQSAADRYRGALATAGLSPALKGDPVDPGSAIRRGWPGKGGARCSRL
jgi:hypothetical protein